MLDIALFSNPQLQSDFPQWSHPPSCLCFSPSKHGSRMRLLNLSAEEWLTPLVLRQGLRKIQGRSGSADLLVPFQVVRNLV